MSRLSRMLEPLDMHNLILPGDPQLSPDNKYVAFTVKRTEQKENAYSSSIWLYDLASGTKKQFTNGRTLSAASRDFSPRFTPDGKTMLFLSDRSGKPQLHSMSMAGGESAQLTSGEPISAFAISPKGGMVVFVSRLPRAQEQIAAGKDFKVINTYRYRFNGQGYLDGRPSHLFMLNLADGKVSQLTHGEYSDSSPTWSPDGSRVSFTSCRRNDWETRPGSDLWIMDLGGGEPVNLTEDKLTVQDHAWHNDGKNIIVAGHTGGTATGMTSALHILDASTGEFSRLIPAFDRSIGCSAGSDQVPPQGDAGPVILDDGRIMFIATDGGDAGIYCFKAGDEAPLKLIGPQSGAVTSFAVSPCGSRIAYSYGDVTHLPDVYFWDGSCKRLTTFNDDLLAETGTQAAERILFPAKDGTMLEGWVIKPAGYVPGKKYPLVFEIHGGPHSAYGNSYYHEFQCLAAQGYGVFYSNPRGSVGYGEQFARAIIGDWCGIDASDLHDAAKYAASLDWVDSSRVGVTGGSQGGYFTNWLIGHTDMFRAAVTQRSMSNVYSKYGTADNGVTHDKSSMGGADLWEDEGLLMERSPIRYARNVKTPLLLLHSEEDYRCPIEQAEQFYAALKRLGQADVEFIRFQGENHDLTRTGKPTSRVEHMTRLIGWFKKYMPA